MYFLTVLEARSAGSGWLWKGLFPGLADSCPLFCVSSGLSSERARGPSVLSSPYYKGTVLWDLGPFKLNYLLKGPVSKCSHVEL